MKQVRLWRVVPGKKKSSPWNLPRSKPGHTSLCHRPPLSWVCCAAAGHTTCCASLQFSFCPKWYVAIASNHVELSSIIMLIIYLFKVIFRNEERDYLSARTSSCILLGCNLVALIYGGIVTFTIFTVVFAFVIISLSG